MNMLKCNEETRNFLEQRQLPKGWIVDQDHIGKWCKVTDTNDANRTMFHGKNWREVLAFCEGVSLMRARNKIEGAQT